MDRKWEYASIVAGLLLLVLGLFGPLFLKPLVNQDFLTYGITLPFILISGFLFSLGKRALGEGWRMVLIGSVLILYGTTLAGMTLSFGYHPVILAWGLVVVVFTVLFYSLMFRLTGASFESPPQDGTVMVKAPYTRTWELCHQAIKLLPSSSILSEDEEKGTIYAEARRLTARSGIIIFLAQVDPGTTRVAVSAMSPGRLWIPELNSAWNKGYVDTLCTYLLQPDQVG
jgi:hypothetical protein